MVLVKSLSVFLSKEFLIAALYFFTSFSITFFNKAVLTVYGFDASNFLTLSQMVCSTILLLGLRNRGLIPNKELSWTSAKQVLPLSISFALMVITGLAGLRFVNIALYSALRRGTTLVVLAGEFFMLGKKTPADETWSVIWTVVGAIIAGAGDLAWSPIGYLLTILNCFVTAAYLIYIKKISQLTKLDNLTLMLYNNILSMPVVAVVSFLTEFDFLISYDRWFDSGFIFCFLMSVFQAFLLNWFIFLCSTVNSPLTTSVTGQIKSILTTILGLFMFGDVEFTSLLSVGLTTSSLASIWYSFIKYQQQVQASSTPPSPL